MKILTAQFVEGSEVFKDAPALWEALSNSDPDFTWGNNNRSLVTVEVLLDALDNIDLDDDELQEEYDTVKERLDPLDPYLYVDLEN